MRKAIWAAMVLLLMLAARPAFAQEEKQKGASTTAYEQASERSVFNRFGDWFVTVGRSEEEKAKILEERNARRAAKRAEKRRGRAEEMGETEAERAEEQAEKRTEKARDDAEELVEESESVRQATSATKMKTTGQKKGSGKAKETSVEAEGKTSGSKKK